MIFVIIYDNKIFYTEISIEIIPKHIFKDSESSLDQINFIKYQSVSEFPSSTRDFSFSITDLFPECMSLADPIDRSILLFDFYENKKLNEIKVGIRLIFQSTLNTLSEEEIQQSVNKLLKPIVDLEGVSIPGL